MKISDITQRSQVQHIAEGRKQLNEIAPVVVAGGALALWLASQGLTAADYYRLAQKNGTEGDPSYDPTDWDTDSQVELGITGAAGLAGGFFGKLVAKPLGWAVGKTMKLASPFVNKSVKQAGKKVKDAQDQVKQAKKLKKGAKGQDKKAAKDLEAETKAKLSKAKADKAKAKQGIGSSTKTGIKRAGRIAGGIGAGTYALDKMGKSVGDLITGKGYEPMTDAEKKARDAADKKAAEAERASRYKSDFITPGIVGQKAYDKYTPKDKPKDKPTDKPKDKPKDKPTEWTNIKPKDKK